jgi:hypothetical protein
MMTARTTISSPGIGWLLGLGFVVILVIGALVERQNKTRQASLARI